MSTELLIWARGFHFGSGMILVGVAAFRWFVLIPAFANESDEAWTSLGTFFRKLQLLVIGAAIGLVTSGFLQFWAVSADMSGLSLSDSLSKNTLSTVLFQTQFGHICQWRLGFAAVFAVMMSTLVGKKWLFRRKVTVLEIGAGLVAVALIVSLAGTGHAAATGGPTLPLRLLADGAHLLAASIWPAGLLPFALFLGCVRATDDTTRLGSVRDAIRRFSNLSFLVVGILIASGIINSYFIVGSFHALFTSDYGQILCLKLLILLVMLGIAACNRYQVLPLLFAQAMVPDSNAITLLLNRLRRFVLVEFTLAVAIVVVVSNLGITPPPH
jgi:putative copper resistance protein D